MKKALAVLALLGLLLACSGPLASSQQPSRAAEEGPGDIERSEEPAQRSRIRPVPRVRLFEAGPSRDEIRRAIGDLKRISLWRPLARHIHRIEIAALHGRHRVPPDGHLADARFSQSLTGPDPRLFPRAPFCRIRMFPRAMSQDLLRWRDFAARGLTTARPPTLRQFWAAILAHELAHCPEKGTDPAPEATARRWEARTVARLRKIGVE